MSDARFYHERLDTLEPYEPFRDDSISQFTYDSRPPARVVMLGRLWCSHSRLPKKVDRGIVSIIEPVVVAILTEEVGNFTVSKEAGDWQRSKSWIGLKRPMLEGKPPQGPQTTDLVIDYRIKGPEKPKLEIQWETAGSWLEDPRSQETQPVHHRLAYELHLATAEVRRRVTSAQLAGREPIGSYDLSNQGLVSYTNYGEDFGPVDHEARGTGSVRVLSISTKPAPWQNVTTESLPQQWINVGLKEADMLPMDCVSVILHFAMAEWRLQNMGTLRGRNIQNEYFDMPDILNNMQQISETRQPAEDYPFFVGTTTDASGCYRQAAIVFIVLGTFAVFLGLLRIIIGPPRLTSWIAQHMALYQSGMVPIKDLDLKAFNSGYKAIPTQAGVLRLNNRKDNKAINSPAQRPHQTRYADLA
ncbi:hypothetical protein HJFPF1_08428 [Paramyrothecium foliicola]|nr:hypothetical protein HJFPF1_08428 [Paramyrothecium foliicola]